MYTFIYFHLKFEHSTSDLEIATDLNGYLYDPIPS